MLKSAQLILYFQSAVRNVGLFTSICVASLTAANAYKPRRVGHAWGLIALYLASLLFLLCAMFVNMQMLRDYEDSLAALQAEDKAIPTINFDNWSMLPKGVFVAQVVIALVLCMSIWKRRGDLAQ
jgi:hypothetical protein